MSVLLDTGTIFAHLNRHDAKHAEGTELMLRLGRKEFGAPLVTDHVIDELFVLARVRTKSAQVEEALKSFLPLPNPALKGLATVSLGAGVLEPAWQVFSKYRDHGISFTDATLIATMKELKIDWLATFDTRLSKLVPSVG